MKIIIPVAILCILLVSSGYASAAQFHPGISETYPSGSPEISTEGLVRAYDMETLNVGAGKDFSAFSEPGVLDGGLTYGGIDGTFGSATSFDGVNDDMVAGDPGLATDTAFTLAMWVKPHSSEGDIVFSGSGGGTLFMSYGGSTCGVVSTNKFCVLYAGGGGNTIILSDFDNTIGVWHSVIFSMAGTTLSLRIDGISESAARLGAVRAWTQISIAAQDGTSFWMFADYDEIALWNRLLTVAEMQAWESGDQTPPEDGPSGELGQETILVLLISVALFFIGLRFPVAWLLSGIAGIAAAAFIYRDIESAISAGLVAGSFILLLVMFGFRVKE